MGQADQQGNTAAPSVPVQWSEGQLVLTPADWRISQQNSVAAESLPTKWSAGQMSLSPADCVIAVRLMDWAVDFMCNFHPRCTISGGSSTTLPSDIELARLTVRLAEVLEVVYSRSKPSIELVRGSADYNIEDTVASGIGRMKVARAIQGMLGLQPTVRLVHLLALRTL